MKPRNLIGLLWQCIILSLPIAMTGCRTLPEPSAEVLAAHDTKHWQRDQVVGLTITLIDPKRIEYMSFGDDGLLVGTYGEVGGKVCGPVSGWRLIRGRLFLCDPDGKHLGAELHLVSISANMLVIRRISGELARYKIHNRK